MNRFMITLGLINKWKDIGNMSDKYIGKSVKQKIQKAFYVEYCATYYWSKIEIVEH